MKSPWPLDLVIKPALWTWNWTKPALVQPLLGWTTLISAWFANLGIDRVETQCYPCGEGKGITYDVILTHRE